MLHLLIAALALAGRLPAAAAGSASGLEPVERLVRVHPSLPAFVFRLAPDPSTAGTWGRLHHVGSIEIFREGSSELVQRIEVESFADESLFIREFRADDVDFDGYVDIGTLYDSGAKWGSYQYRVFDPSTGRFVTNGLTDELREIGGNELRFDPSSRTVSAILLTAEGSSIKTWRLAGGHLVPSPEAERERELSSEPDDAVSIGPGIEPPRCIEKTDPVYPNAMRREKRSGIVVIEAVISATGEVLRPRVIRSAGAEFDRAALDAIAHSRFEAGKKDGKAIAVRIRESFRFSVR